ncbi:ATP-binding protein [Amycolatopsis sp. H20-H5]|uniref:ATP-binding protein n=1 Tax=Amycolatopsis sp. H20-H5 TaxID=3046309 RepID=UPI002DB7E661|nr:tetratricopeptide repeat protein [Amycolatopsis sp. H20-H5]MEC3981398.1 tetratricopeptide repeat protein [Amycolatopsis sp. H20-H5]
MGTFRTAVVVLRRGWELMGERATFGAELRRLRRAADLPLTELADRIHYSKGYLSKVETGLAAPNASLAALCEAELGVRGALTPLLPREPARRKTRPDVRPSGLPAVPAHFSGRTREIQAVRAALEADGGICVVSGMGGVGKTALAVWCAHRLEGGFADGCLFLDLRGQVSDAHDRLLRVLGVPAEAIPSDVDDRAALYRTRLRGRSFLLVLDNAGSAGQVRSLLPAEPKCRVLVTSRHRLAALDDARHVPLDVLPETDAIDLFTTLTGSDDTEAVTRVVGRCARLPLALRIAAARLRGNPAWTLAELERRLADEAGRLGELDDGERSLTAVFQLSHQDLTAAQARLFGLLALHPGADFDATAAAALTESGVREADRLLGALHDAHLITQPAAGRYGFHDLLRAFARGVPPAEDLDDAFRRLLDLAVRTAALGDKLLTPQRYRPELTFGEHAPEPVPLDGEEAAVSWFRAEWPNLVALCRAAGERGLHDRCWQLAFMLRSFFFLSKLWDQWIATHRWALAAAEALGDPRVRAITATNLGVALIDRGDLDEAARQYRDALVAFREIGDGDGESTVLANHAWISHYRGEDEDALRDLRLALAHYERTGNRRNAAITKRGISLVQTARGEYDDAVAVAEAAITTFEDLGLELDLAMAFTCVGWAWFHAGRHHRAARAYADAAARSEACGSTFEAARAYTGLGNVAAATGATAEARSHWDRADATHSALDPVVVGEARHRPRP